MQPQLDLPSPQTPTPIPLPSILRVDQMVDLSQIFRPEIDIVCLTRTLEPELITAAEELCQETTEQSWKGITDAEDAEEILEKTLPNFSGSKILAQDLSLMVDILETLLDTDQIGVRLARRIRPMCPAFHRDQVMLRLVATYLGPATEFLCETSLERTESHFEVPKKAPIQRAQTGDIVLLKGSAWPGNEARGAIHRSPPQPDGSPRIVGTLDPLWKAD